MKSHLISGLHTPASGPKVGGCYRYDVYWEKEVFGSQWIAWEPPATKLHTCIVYNDIKSTAAGLLTWDHHATLSVFMKVYHLPWILLVLIIFRAFLATQWCAHLHPPHLNYHHLHNNQHRYTPCMCMCMLFISIDCHALRNASCVLFKSVLMHVCVPRLLFAIVRLSTLEDNLESMI